MGRLRGDNHDQEASSKYQTGGKKSGDKKSAERDAIGFKTMA